MLSPISSLRMGKNKQKMVRPETSHKPFWKWGLCFFCIALLLINIVLILIALPSSGWDFRVYISAVIAVLQQLNPYDPGVISQFSMLPNFPFAYPPIPWLFFISFTLQTFFISIPLFGQRYFLHLFTLLTD